MQVPKETILKLADLVRLDLTPTEITNLSSDLTRIMEYCDRLKGAEIDPAALATSPDQIENVLRDDIIRPSLKTEQALKNAPEKKDNFFVVPRVIQ